MQRLSSCLRVVAVAGLSVLGGACGSDDPVQCGQGTTLVGNTCVANTSPGVNPAQLPTFAGATAVAPASATSLFVAWDAAQSATPPERMRYVLFVADGGSPIDYTKPTVTTERGVQGFYLKGLQAKTYDIVVRALDDADRTDQNGVVKSAAPGLDGASPAFGGAKSAEAGGSGVVTVKWDVAQDDLTAPAAMVYLVYVGDETNDIDLTVPTVITKPGATSVDVKGLFKSSSLYRFVVRARDAADNMDANATTVTSRAGADVTPPRFDGCNAAVADSAGSAIVSWSKATDDVTPEKAIVYDVYASVDEATFDFFAPIVSVNDATSVRVTALASNTAWRFVCRARDYTGNTDGNVVQRAAKTLTDSTPPTFIGSTDTTVDSLARTVTFSWAPAEDDKTPVDQIVYDVYEAKSSKAQTFDRPPRASSSPGATSLTVTDLTPDTTLFWVVRARDQGGNHDSNTKESNGAISVSFVRQVQPIFTQDCAVSGCHVPGNPMAGLILAPGFAYGALVDVRAAQSPDRRVVPTDPTSSYLYKKISQNPPPVGWQMPAPATGSVLSTAEKELVRRWIAQGAVNN
jgi:hypothetical protein